MKRPALNGGGLVLAGHAATVAIPAVLALWLAAPDNAYDEDRTWFFLYGFLLGQIALMFVAVIAGAMLAASKPNRRAGMAVFAGWGSGLVLAPILTAVTWYTFIHPGGG